MHRESSEIQYGYINGHVNITCQADDEPAAFSWYHNNEHLDAQHHQIVYADRISILQVKVLPENPIKNRKQNQKTKMVSTNLGVFERIKNIRRIFVRST